MLRLTRLFQYNGLVGSPTMLLLGSKGGTPKRKKNPYMIRRKVYGIHFKEKYLRLQ